MSFLFLIGLVAAVAFAARVGPGPYLAVQVPYPGTEVLLVQVATQFVASFAGAVCLGGLVFALCCTRPNAKMRLGPRGYAGLRTAERASPLWAVSALFAMVTSATVQAGRAPWDLLHVEDPVGRLVSLVSVSERSGAWLVVAVLATAVAALSRCCLGWASCAGLAWLSVFAVVAPWMTQNAGDGPNHDWASGAAVWTSVGLAVLVGVGAQMRGDWTQDRAAAQRRARRTSAVALGMVAAGSAVLGALLIPLSAMPSTWYGQLGLAAAVLFALAAAAVFFGKLTVAAGAGVVLLAVAEAMSVQPAPAFAGQRFSVPELLLGFDFPGAPTLWRLLSAWRFDVVFGTLAVLLAAAYVLGAARLRGRGDAWSPWRTLSFLFGCALLLLVTSSGIGRYASGQFSYHMISHMGLNMFAPVFLVLGAPVTLLLRAAPTAGQHMAGPREWALALVHARLVQILAHPLVAVGLFVVSLYGLYFTPVFGLLVRYHWGHLLMTLHFLAIGYTYYWAIIGVDPGARRLPHLARLGMLFAVMPFHAFFGVAVLSDNEIIGGDFYRWLALPWVSDLASDQRVAGAVAWTSGEIPIVFVVGALLYQWAGADRRAASRADRHAADYEDAELDAYNHMLQKLVERG
ncbi:Cytochrome c oxidase caa3-type, assembly factor CtaG-related protein [Segniliparus rotundus DSM 44985]|uniref:Cytochrome c oxidase caa3-type, assembly factor CtaG-related protein n=1 Tax=Segniliparus rotundus (strain ATCC BAA-972 / CDC 1076 / CIP 108378 / DSM 44985 / JCM 13578) TaxID=640132 RepID=D6ZA85_SEGRD|nr:cytochrome c oxidase assembly protein [Segniliparus rotundus]ADG96627.1 Cytochrome c oxidase caa3-type, assembly factor CtaG-related protein [Segniliparus rotundus DSM 44985]